MCRFVCVRALPVLFFSDIFPPVPSLFPPILLPGWYSELILFMYKVSYYSVPIISLPPPGEKNRPYAQGEVGIKWGFRQ